MTFKTLAHGAVALLLGSAAALSSAGAKDVYTTFSVPKAIATEPQAINANGDTAGIWTDSVDNTGSFIRHADGTTELFVLGDTMPTQAYGLNDKDQVVGFYATDNNNQWHGFLRDPDGTLTTFDEPDGAQTFAELIDDNGTIYGQFTTQDSVYRVFLRAADGTYTAYDAPGAGTKPQQGTWPMAINRWSALVGFYDDGNENRHGYLRQADGTSVEIAPPGATQTAAVGVDDAGNVTGDYLDAAGVPHGFVRAADGTFTVVDAPNASDTLVSGGNGKGKMWGFYYDNAGNRHGFILRKDGKIRPFDEPNGTAGSTNPIAMNRKGAIVGWYRNIDGRERGFIRDKDK
jgi:hypothetical protein